MEKIKTSFRDMTLGQKIEHIWEYYKPVIFGIAAAVAVIVYMIYKVLTPEPDIVFNATLVNANSYDAAEENVFVRYLEEQGYDTETETAYVNAGLTIDNENASQNSAASMQVLSAMVMVGEIDLLVGNEYTLQLLAMNGGLMPVDQILTEEQQEKYRDRFYTVENPETGEETVCGIWLGEKNALVEDGFYYGKVLVAVPYTAVHVDMAREMISYLLEQE